MIVFSSLAFLVGIVSVGSSFYLIKRVSLDKKILFSILALKIASVSILILLGLIFFIVGMSVKKEMSLEKLKDLMKDRIFLKIKNSEINRIEDYYLSQQLFNFLKSLFNSNPSKEKEIVEGIFENLDKAIEKSLDYLKPRIDQIIDIFYQLLDKDKFKDKNQVRKDFLDNWLFKRINYIIFTKYFCVSILEKLKASKSFDEDKLFKRVTLYFLDLLKLIFEHPDDLDFSVISEESTELFNNKNYSDLMEDEIFIAQIFSMLKSYELDLKNLNGAILEAIQRKKK